MHTVGFAYMKLDSEP